MVSFKRTRSEREADEVRVTAYRKCGLATDNHSVKRSAAVVRNLLFFERRQNRRIMNAAELCTELNGSAWRTRLFVEPADLDFCTQVAQMQWADVVVSKIGSQVEYAGLARRGSVLIVVHGYSLLVFRESLPQITHKAGVQLLDWIDTNSTAISEETLRSTKVPRALQQYSGLCALMDFSLMAYFSFCSQFYLPHDTYVPVSEMRLTLRDAQKVLASQVGCFHGAHAGMKNWQPSKVKRSRTFPSGDVGRFFFEKK